MIIKQSSLTLKVMLSVLFTAMTPSVTFTDLSLQAQNECYQDTRDGWKYVEFLFVEQPKHELEAALAKAQAALMTLGALVILKNDIYAFVAAKLGHKLPEEEKTIEVLKVSKIYDPITKQHTTENVWDKVKKADNGINIKSSIAQIAIGKLAYDLYANYMKKSIQKSTLVSFLSNLETYQARIPSELMPAFNELATRQNNLTDREVAQVFEIVQHLLEHTFAARYKTDAKSADVLGTLKTFSDLGKNFNG